MLVTSRYKSEAIWINPQAYPLGLIGAFTFNEKGSGASGTGTTIINFFDSYTRQAVSYSFNGNALQLFNVLNAGGSTIYNNSGSGFGITDNSQVTRTFDPKTWVLWAGTPAATDSTLAGKSDNDSVGAGWAIGMHNTNGLAIAIENTGADVKFTCAAGGVGPWTETIHFMAFTWDGTQIAANQRVLIDGIVQVHTSDQNGSGTHLTDDSNTLLFGISRNGPAYGGANAISESFFLFNRPLTTPELQELYIAPYKYYTAQMDTMISAGVVSFVNSKWFNNPLKIQ
jgi:hypothetical protein